MELNQLSDKELEAITTLLKDNHLPFEDIVSSKVTFVTYKANEKIVGCIGMEHYGDQGLLRSFAIHDDYKGKGIGTQLLTQLIEKSYKKGLKKIHLLTTTADTYFAHKGFQVASRDIAPTVIANSKEFSEICPASSVYMIKTL